VRSSLTKKRNLRQIAAVLLLSLAGCDSESDRVLEETFERLYTIQPASDISIQNRDGAVLDVSAQPNSVSISTKLPPKPRWALFDRSGTVDYTIVVPATVNVSQLRLDAGEVLVDGMHGQNLHASLGDGRMSAHNCFTDLNVALQRGNLAISYDWWEHGTLSVQANTARGNTLVFLPSEAAFHLVAETRHGKIANDFDKPAIAPPTSAEATKIDMLAHGGGNAAIKVRTENGDIKVMAANP